MGHEKHGVTVFGEGLRALSVRMLARSTEQGEARKRPHGGAPAGEMFTGVGHSRARLPGGGRIRTFGPAVKGEAVPGEMSSLGRLPRPRLLPRAVASHPLSDHRHPALPRHDTPAEEEGFEFSVPRVMDGDSGRQVPALIAAFELAGTAVALQRGTKVVRPDRHPEFR